MGSTHKALMARGLDSDRAGKLVADGWTLSKLKQAKREELDALGLEDNIVAQLLSEARPPIPEETLTKLLFNNRFQCCVCRDPKRSIIVHHIREWAESRSHDIANLAVLCLDHHGEAHSKRQLSQNLDPDTLLNFKDQWESAVKRFDAEAVYSAMRLEYSSWNFINELRVFEIAKELNVDFKAQPRWSRAFAAGIVNVDGIPLPVANDDLFYMYEGPNILDRYFYVSEVLNAVVRSLPVINVSDYLDKGTLGFGLALGDFIFVQGAHVFSPMTAKKSGTGRGQICEGVRRANQVEIRFVFDRWEATSSSAKNQWLTGTRNQGSLVHVKDLTREDGRLVVRGTVLGICSNHGSLKQREYANKWLEWTPANASRADKIWQI